MKKATAYANANIALVKYWGKSDQGLNIPAVSSISMTLKDLGAKVALAPRTHAHELIINGENASLSSQQRTMSFLEYIRALYHYDGFMQVSSKSSIPIASGLASSAAYFASLTTAVNEALDLKLDQRELSILARVGSGSAARSIFGGFAALKGGAQLCHDEAHAYEIRADASQKLHMILAVIDDGVKSISSRNAMIITKETSPFFQAFVDSHTEDFTACSNALIEGDFVKLGHIMEHSTQKMFATMFSAKPAIIYWRPKTLALIEAIKALCETHGPIAFFTMDAGPNVKILCQEKDLALVVRTVAKAGLTKNIFCTTTGDAAKVIS